MKHSIVALFLTLIAIPAGATRIQRLSLQEIRDRASAVVVAEVLGSETRVGEARMVWTDYRLRIVEAMSGEKNAGDLLTLSFAGGRAGLDAGVAGVPRLERGARYLIFVDDTRLRPVPAIGWGQGIFRIGSAIESADGDRLEIDGEGKIGRARIATEDHRKRLADPLILNGDGSVAPRRPQRASTSDSRQLATLDDLRNFVCRSIEARP